MTLPSSSSHSSSSSSSSSSSTPPLPTTKPLLSKSWRVIKTHQHIYTGGQILLSYNEKYLLCWCNGNIMIVDVGDRPPTAHDQNHDDQHHSHQSHSHNQQGATIGMIQANHDDSDGNDDSSDTFLTFTLHPNNTTIAVSTTRSLMIRVYDIHDMIQHYYHQTPTHTHNNESIHPTVIRHGFKPHTTYPTLDLSYDSTGTLLATCSVDRTVRVFSVTENYTLTHIFRGHQTVVSHIFWYPHTSASSSSSNASLLFSCSDDGEIRVWNLSTNQCVAVLNNHMSLVTDMIFDIDQNRNCIYSVGRDKIISYWDRSTYTLLHTIPVYESMNSIVSLSSNHRIIPSLSGTDNHSVNKKGDPSSSTSYYMTAGEKGELRVWDAMKRQTINTHHMPGVSSLTAAATSSSSSTATPTTPLSKNITHLLYGQQSNRVIAVTGEHNIYIYTYTSPSTPLKHNKLLIGYNHEIIDIKYNTWNHHIYVATNSHEIKCFDLYTFDAQILASPHGHSDIVLSIDISADGQYLMSCSKDKSIRFWSCVTHECIGIAEGHTESIGVVKFMMITQSDELWCMSGARDRTIKRWNCTPLLTYHQKSATDDDNKQHQHSTTLLEIQATHTKILHHKDINCIAISPNNKLIATGGQDKSIQLVNSYDLSHVATLNGHTRGVWCLSFSVYDKILASGSSDCTIKLWNMNDYTCIKTLQSHHSSVLQLSFINVGMQLMSADADGLLKIWSIKQNECINTYDQHEGKIWSMMVVNDKIQQHPQNKTKTHANDDNDSEDGREGTTKHPLDGSRVCITGGMDSVLRIWEDVTVEEYVEELQENALKHKREQALDNLVYNKKYGAAVLVALDLKHPRKLYKILELLSTPQLDSSNSENIELHNVNAIHAIAHENYEALKDIISRLELEKMNILLDYCRQWNTNSRYSYVAHRVLHMIFQLYTPQSLMECNNFIHHLDAFLLYSEKHSNRLNTLMQKSYLLDYTYQAMRLLTPNRQPYTDTTSSDDMQINGTQVHSDGTTRGDSHDIAITGSQQQVDVSVSGGRHVLNVTGGGDDIYGNYEKMDENATHRDRYDDEHRIMLSSDVDSEDVHFLDDDGENGGTSKTRRGGIGQNRHKRGGNHVKRKGMNNSRNDRRQRVTSKRKKRCENVS